MQLAMYQMLSNLASNSSSPPPPPSSSSLRIRSMIDQLPPPPPPPLPIITHHPKPLKRLGHSQKRPRLVKSNPTSE